MLQCIMLIDKTIFKWKSEKKMKEVEYNVTMIQDSMTTGLCY